VRSLRIDNILAADNPFEDSGAIAEREVLNERGFKRMIALERKRSERSQEPFLLMLVDMGSRHDSKDSQHVLESMISVLKDCSRDTDVIGWYRERETLGVMFTALLVNDKHLILTTILNRISSMLRDELTFDQFNQVNLSFHFFPDDWDESDPKGPTNATLYPDLIEPGSRKRTLLLVKRSVDVVASAIGLAVLSPVFLGIAAAIKLTSKGPVFFKQDRVGQYGRLFTVLKFRSMFVQNDCSVHRDFVVKLIRNQAQPTICDGNGVYKLTNDRRITAVGRFLRRTSLDELPQIINVLLGHMSLVGPRPPIPYELAAYQTWHRRRILEAKPGITGLWQVTGRSQVKFDEMVRLDLRYATTWSLWLDLKILLMTPMAVIKGSGAY
jgi:lipopolysaccharide/colanic/teichoic acid biosynthesis glycosyltransferase